MPDWLDDFDGPALGAAWVDSYLPAWSSRAASRAHWRLADSALRLSVPADHPVWCADRHSPPIRVSGVQSGNFSGPVGSTRGQQPFRAGLSVAEEQHEHWGWTPHGGEVTVRARMGLGPRSMASAWLIGRELDPAESAEICVMEIFGREYGADGAVQVGMGCTRSAIRGSPRTSTSSNSVSTRRSGTTTASTGARTPSGSRSTAPTC